MLSKEKFIIVMEPYTLSETDLARSCKENGLYVEQVKQWSSSCIAVNDGIKRNNIELKEDKK